MHTGKVETANTGFGGSDMAEHAVITFIDYLPKVTWAATVMVPPFFGISGEIVTFPIFILSVLLPADIERSILY